MAGTLMIKITRASGEIHDLRYRLIWSAWLDGRLLGKGHAFRVEEAVERVQDLVSPEEVDRIEIQGP
ncbi:MAG: hypothetical protein ACYC6T_18325 [Thermoleophilia bacterium]